MKVEGQLMTFRVDTRAEHSMITTPVAPLTGQPATIIWATGDMAGHSFFKACSSAREPPGDSSISVLTGMPHSPAGYRLTDKDEGTNHLCGWKAKKLHPGEPVSSDDDFDCAQGRCMAFLFLRREQMNPPRLLKEFPDVWSEKGPPGLSKNHASTVVDLKPGATPVKQKQYPVSQAACQGIQDHTQHL